MQADLSSSSSSSISSVSFDSSSSGSSISTSASKSSGSHKPSRVRKMLATSSDKVKKEKKKDKDHHHGHHHLHHSSEHNHLVSPSSHTTATSIKVRPRKVDKKRGKKKEKETSGEIHLVKARNPTILEYSPRRSMAVPNMDKQGSAVTIMSLPNELTAKIFLYLPHFPGLIRCSTVCKKWHGLAFSEILWRQVYLGKYEKIASDRLLVWIAALNPRLEVLSLKGCTQVTDVGLTAALGRCYNLRELHLEDLERQFTTKALSMIGKLCPNLDTLVLPGILEHPDEIIEPIITYCPNLRVFKSFSQFSESTVKCIAERCKNLQKLRMGTTTKLTILSQAAVKYLIQCTNLQSLECGYFSLGEVDWGKKALGRLKAFRAFGWFDMTPDALRAFLKNTPNLEVLHLIHSGGEIGESLSMDSYKFQYIGQSCPSLRDINLCDTPFCEADVQVLVKECRNLRELRVGMKSNPGTRFEITDSWVYQVINFSAKIEVLKIYHADIRTDTISMLTRGCKHMRSLTLGRCSQITTLTSHLEVLPTLQKLSLRNTPTNDSALQMLMSAFPALQTVTLIETGVSDALIGYIIGRYRLSSIKLQPRARLTNSGEILYRGGRFAKKQTLTEQEKMFQSLFHAENLAEVMIKKESKKYTY